MLAGYALVASGLPLPLGGDHGPRSAPAEKRLAVKDRSRPFPCQDKPCGCATAEQCFSNCCCNTPAETLAWARAHGVDPAVIAALQRRVAARPETSVSAEPVGASSCCSAQRRDGGRATRIEPACSPGTQADAGLIALDGPEICSEFAALAARPEQPETRRANAGTAFPAPDSPDVEPMSSHTVVLKSMLACGGIVSQWLSIGGAPPPQAIVAVVAAAPLVEVILPGDACFSGCRAAPDAPPPRVA